MSHQDKEKNRKKIKIVLVIAVFQMNRQKSLKSNLRQISKFELKIKVINQLINLSDAF